MRRRQAACAGSAMTGTAGVVAAGLGLVTNYASAAVPGWAAHAWVIWPLFVVLMLAGIGLMLRSRRLDGAARPPARLGPVGRPARGRQESLRPPHVECVRGREAELAELAGMLRRPRGRFAVLCAAGGMGRTTVAAQFASQANAAGWRVFWVRWRDSAELAQQMVQTARACGLPRQSCSPRGPGGQVCPMLCGGNWAWPGGGCWCWTTPTSRKRSARQGNPWPITAVGSARTAEACW